MDKYEKLYNEALERARTIHSEIVNNEIIGFPGQIEGIFPELRESEDEKTRKALIETINCLARGDALFMSEDTRQRYIAYLEKQKEPKPYGQRDECKDCQANYAGSCKGTCEMKQKEQKPAEWNPEDEQNLNVCLSYIKDESLRSWLIDAIHVRYDKPAWSEEDELMRKRCIADLGYLIAYEPQYKERYDAQIDWLKSLRPSWKPSDEQMFVLGRFLKFLHESGSTDFGLMDSLLGKLKTL